MTTKNNRFIIRTKEEFNLKVREYAKDQGLTITQFIITALLEKMNKIDSPGNNQIFQKTNGKELVDKLDSQTKVIMNGLKQLELLQKTQNFVDKYGDKKEKLDKDLEEVVLKCFIGRLRPVSVKDIIDQTNLSYKDIIHVLNNSEKIRSVKGRGFELVKRE